MRVRGSGFRLGTKSGLRSSAPCSGSYAKDSQSNTGVVEVGEVPVAPCKQGG